MAKERKDDDHPCQASEHASREQQEHHRAPCQRRPKVVPDQLHAHAQSSERVDGPIEKEKLFGMTIYDASTMYMGRGFWLHLACLNSRLHHKYAILDLKFDPDNMQDLDKL